MLTIGQLAAHAGVTVRAVRHYHARGLLPEPERDASGYRRYDANAVVDLIRIRTLADAGVPLSRVKELLEADEEEFAAAVAEIDKRLRAEIREQQKRRERINRLAAGDSLALPSDRCRLPGPAARARRAGADGRGRAGRLDPHRGALTGADGQMDRAQARAARGPRGRRALPAILRDDRLAARRPTTSRGWPTGWRPPSPRPRAGRSTTPTTSWPAGRSSSSTRCSSSSVPAAGRLMELLEERGWSGWTELEPTATEGCS